MDERTATPMLARMRTLIAVGLVACGGALLVPAGASATAGAIEGSVKKEGAVALEHARVCVLGSETSECKRTGAGGTYAISGLTNGKKYTVVFTGEQCPMSEAECTKEFVTQYWQDKSTPGEATEIEAGATGIDATLEEGGKITGTVTRATGGTPINLTRVCAFRASVNNFSEFFEELFRLAVVCVVSEPNGTYSIGGLAAGEYKVGFTGEVCAEKACAELNESEVFATQYYAGQQTIEGASHVPVAAKATTEHVNAALVEAPPANLEPPKLTGGATVGGTLQCSEGAWEGAVRVEYAWLRNGSPIAGQSTPNYVVQSGDAGSLISCRVTAFNRSGGGESATSNSAHIPIIATTSTTTSTSAPAPGTAALSGSPSVKNGNVTLTLRCTGSGACAGTAKLLVKVTEKRTVKSHGKRRIKKVTRTITVGEGGYSIAAGGNTTLTVHLTSKGRSLLRSAGKKGLSVTLSGLGVQGSSFVLKEKQRKKK